MKYLISLVTGVVIGAALFLIGLYYNPFAGRQSISPLAVTDMRIVELTFSAVPGDGVLYTDHGQSNVTPHPRRVAELWEPAIADTRVWVTRLQNSRGQPAGVGIKFSSDSEQTRILDGEALVNSIWHIYLPEQGTFMIDQTENYWSYVRDIVIPARLNSGDNWRGTFHGTMTVGPGSLGTARVTGGSGIYAGLKSESVESVTARGYSAISGPVSMNGGIAIALPADSELP